MSTDAQSARDDLAFLRGLVDDDWRPGLWAFGALYIAIGAVICLHVAITDFTPLRGWGLLTAYIVLYGAFSFAPWLIYRRRPRHATAGVKTRTGGAALLGAFSAHLVMLAVFVILAVRQHNGIFLELAPLVLSASQGALWLVVHAMRRRSWHLAEALGWYAATIALAPLVDTALYGPALAVVVIILMIFPGVVMMRAASKPA